MTTQGELLTPILERWDARLAALGERPFDSCRVFHGRGGCYPGLEWCCIDLHWPLVLVTLFRPAPPGFAETLQAALEHRMTQLGLTCLVYQHRYETGAPFELAGGELPDPLLARRGDLKFQLSLQQQNTGFFLDMEPGRQWLEPVVRGRSLLNLFAYTCAFSVVAQAAGAERVVNVDMSSRSLSVGRDNHRLNQQPTHNIAFMAENILKSWSRIRRKGPFDVIVVDPPSFQKGSFVASRDYAKVLRRLPELVAPSADVLLCLNAPELGESFLREQMETVCPDFQFNSRLPAHLDFPDVESQRQLKLFAYKVVASGTEKPDLGTTLGQQ